MMCADAASFLTIAIIAIACAAVERKSLRWLTGRDKRPAVANPGSRATSSNVQRSSSDTIRIEQLEILANIGVTAEERAQPQRIVLNITVFSAVRFEDMADDIERTVNYVDICSHSRDFVGSQQWNLIETLAARLSSNLMKIFRLSGVEVEVRKFVLPNTAFVAATARRTRTS